MGTVYLITCLVTGKYYVGQTTWPRIARPRRKYGNDNDKHDYYTYGHNHIRDAIVDKNT
jgi:hypothetical protein